MADICEVWVNGKPAGVKGSASVCMTLPDCSAPGDNTIYEVKVTTSMGNYIQTLKDNKVQPSVLC